MIVEVFVRPKLSVNPFPGKMYDSKSRHLIAETILNWFYCDVLPLFTQQKAAIDNSKKCLRICVKKVITTSDENYLHIFTIRRVCRATYIVDLVQF